MKRNFFITRILFLALMILTPSQIYSGTPDVQKTDGPKNVNSLKILTWNIYMLPYCSLIKGNCRRARGIAKELSISDYDIIVFEEAFDFRARRIIKKKLEKKYPYIYGPANELFFSFRVNSGLWVLSKVPLKKLKEIQYKTRYGIDAMARKGAVLFEGEWLGHAFQLAGTHLQADSPDSIRREQCREISSDLLIKYARTNVPQIVCGDFNIEMDDNENYHYMLNTLDAQDGNIEGDICVSFDEIDNQLAKRENGKKCLIDYVLIRNYKRLKEVRRRVAVFKAYHNNLSFDLSDHYGIEAYINFGLNPELSVLPCFPDLGDTVTNFVREGQAYKIF
jgi:endonuclease/exonuclease/phosphatase family metal-dependent hydrolase